VAAVVRCRQPFSSTDVASLVEKHVDPGVQQRKRHQDEKDEDDEGPCGAHDSPDDVTRCRDRLSRSAASASS
jgi:hypothetical protein